MRAHLSSPDAGLPANDSICAQVNLAMGVSLGLLIEYVIAPAEAFHIGTHHSKDFVEFNVEVFSFLLLPIIIFR